LPQSDTRVAINQVVNSLKSQEKQLREVEGILQKANLSQRESQKMFKGSEARDESTAERLEVACTELDDMDRTVKELTDQICSMTLAVREVNP